MPQKTKDEARTTLYMPIPLKKRLQQRAQEERRSLSQYVCLLLEDALEEGK